MPKGIHNSGRRCGAPMGNTYRLGQLTPRLAATEKATSNDIRWAAGFFEGEGALSGSGGSTNASINQKDSWTLKQMRDLFGGSVLRSTGHLPTWRVSGARARGFLMSIYGLLSPRRQEQIRKAMHTGEFNY